MVDWGGEEAWTDSDEEQQQLQRSRTPRMGGDTGDIVPIEWVTGNFSADNAQPRNWMRGTSTPVRGYREGGPGVITWHTGLVSLRDELRGGPEGEGGAPGVEEEGVAAPSS